MSVIIPVVLLIVIILCAVDWWIKKTYVEKLKSKNCVPYLPIIGSLHHIVGKGIKNFLTEFTNSESSCLLWILHKPIYYVRQPEELQAIFLNRNSMNKTFIYQYAEILANSILIVKYADGWSKRRRALNKCFNHRQVGGFTPVFNDFAEVLRDQIESEMTVEDFTRKVEINFLDNFFSTVGNFGGNKTISNFLKFDMYDAIKQNEPTLMKRYLNPWLHPDIVFFNTEDGKRMKTSDEKIDKNVIEIVNQKRENLNETKEDDNGTCGVLDVLMTDYTDMEQIKSEIKMFGGAAIETSGSAMCSVLLLLGIHQDIQERVYEEIISVVGLEDAIKEEHLPQLKYTLMVLKESLRIFPPVVFIMRSVESDLVMGDRIIPKGTDILISILNMHRDEKLWKDPLKFIPERFSPEETAKRHPCSFIPFSFGSRNCIGKRYSEMALLVNLATILRSFKTFCDCKRVEDVHIESSLLLHLPPELKIKFMKRSK